MLSILASMGTSPPIITEFVHYVSKFEKVGRVEMIATSEKMVQNSTIFAEAALKHRFPNIFVATHFLNVADISTEEENYVFMEAAAKILARMKRHGDKVYVCLAGGRKEMVASLVLLAQLSDVDGLFHVVAPDVKAFNQELEKIRTDIENLAKDANPMDYYRKHSEKFDPIMYPPAETYNVVKVPFLPYPPSTLQKLKQMFSRDFFEGKTDETLMEKLKKMGFVSIKGDKIILSDEAKKFYKHVLQHL